MAGWMSITLRTGRIEARMVTAMNTAMVMGMRVH